MGTRRELRSKEINEALLEACDRLGVAPPHAAAVEDSSNGLRAAHAAGMRVIAAPNPHFPPQPDALTLADVRIEGLDELTVELVEGLRA